MWDLAGADDDARLDRLRTHLGTAQRIARIGTWEAELPSGSVWWSPELDPVLGWPSGEDGGFERLLAVVHPDDRVGVARTHAAAVRDATPYAIDHRIVRGDGIRHVHHEVVVERDGDRPVRLLGTIQDVTEQMRVARRLVDTESRRRELLHRLVQASAVARNQLAADLHDGPVQVLTATAMRLEVLARTTEAPPAWLHDAVATVRDVCTQLREVLFELQPQMLDGGLEDAVAHLASTVLPGTPVAVTVHGEGLGPAAGRAVHGVVQEALWDVREHTSADRLSVDVVVRDVVSVVLDGGAGDRPLLTRSGLLGVRERCEAAGGAADLDEGGRVLRCSLTPTDDERLGAA
ncbi:MAG: histidine kinase [Acidimicrobiia bacterium]